MGSLLRKITERTREEARQPGSWAVFVFLGLVNVGQAAFLAESALSVLSFVAIAGLSMFIAFRFFR